MKNLKWSLGMGWGVGLALVLAGCGVRPDQRPSDLAGDGATTGTFALSGIEWSFRQARLHSEAGNSAPYKLSDSLSFKAFESEEKMELEAPLPWPDGDGAQLVMALRSSEGREMHGTWSSFCQLPDGATRGVKQPAAEVRHLLWDAESSRAILPLAEVFGAGGDRYDPATRCQIQIHVPGRPTATLVLGVVGGFPGVRTEVVSDLWMGRNGAVSLGQEFRVEKWTNTGDWDVVMRWLPVVDLASEQCLIAVVYPGRTNSPPGPLAAYNYGAVTKGYALEASMDGGEWLPAGSNFLLRSGRQQELRVRFAALPEASGCKLPPLAAKHYRWKGGLVEAFPIRISPTKTDVRHEGMSVGLSRFTGTIQWIHEIGHPGGSEVRLRKQRERSEQPVTPNFMNGRNRFDCKGWVS